MPSPGEIFISTLRSTFVDVFSDEFPQLSTALHVGDFSIDTVLAALEEHPGLAVAGALAGLAGTLLAAPAIIAGVGAAELTAVAAEAAGALITSLVSATAGASPEVAAAIGSEYGPVVANNLIGALAGGAATTAYEQLIEALDRNPSPIPPPSGILPGSVTLIAGSPSPVEQNQTTDIATIVPSTAGGPITLTQTAGTGILSLGPVQTDGSEDVIYTAPASISASTMETVSFYVTEDGVNAPLTVPVQLDAGPSITLGPVSALDAGQTEVVGTVTPGLSGDTLSLASQTTSAGGTLSLGPVTNGTQQVIYTAPASVPANTTDSVSYTISDQHNDAMASDSVPVPLDAAPTPPPSPEPTLIPAPPPTGSTSITVPSASGGQPFTVSFSASELDFPTVRSTTSSITMSVLATVISGEGSIIPPILTVTAGNYISSSQPFGGLFLSQGAIDTISLEGDNISGNYVNVPVPLSINNATGGNQTFNLTVNQNVYEPAQASFSAAGTAISSLDFGIVHVGDDISQSLTVTNAATEALTDVLRSGALTDSTDPSDPFSNSGPLGDIAGGSSGTITYALNTSAAGNFSAAQAFLSHDDALPDISAGSLSLEAQVNQYAQPAFAIDNSYSGETPGETLQHNGNNWTVNLGEVEEVEGSPTASIALLIQNVAANPGDDLSGTFGFSGTGFSVSADPFQDAAPGSSAGSDVYVTVNPSDPGAHTETITLYPTGSNASGYSGTLPDQILTITDDVVIATPTISGTTPSPIEQNQTTVVGTVTPGQAGDTLTLTETAGTGTVSLGAVQADGTQQVIYTAPASVPTSMTDAVDYTISENGVTATSTANVQLDAGPSITPQTPSAIDEGQTTVIGTVAPGLAGDTLTVNETAGAGTVSLGTVQPDGTQQVIYTAPASISASTTDAVSYTVSDQHNDAVASGSASVPLNATPTGFDGDLVSFVQYDPAMIPADIVATQTATVVPGTTTFPEGDGSLTVSGDTMTFLYQPSAEGYEFTSGSFNGGVLTDLGANAGNILGATLLSTNVAGLTASDIGFTPDSVSINAAGLSLPTNAPGFIQIGVDFANQPSGASSLIAHTPT